MSRYNKEGNKEKHERIKRRLKKVAIKVARSQYANNGYVHLEKLRLIIGIDLSNLKTILYEIGFVDAEDIELHGKKIKIMKMQKDLKEKEWSIY